MKNGLIIGLDFGSDSVRAVLTDADGRILSGSVCAYPRWSQGMYSDASENRFRQHPLDYMESAEKVIRETLSGQDSSKVCGIGIDATASTPCAVNADGVPLALTPEFQNDPDAMFILWKDHTALAEAEEINDLIRRKGIDYTQYSGGCCSAEWFFPKYLHILRNNEKVRAACCGFAEHCDWFPAMLTGNEKSLRRSRCAAGHKALWHEDWGGVPPQEFFTELDPLFEGRITADFRQTYTADTAVGTLCPEWAERLGLNTDVVVSAGLIDAHAGAVGAGVRPGRLVKVYGTSTCDIAVAEKTDHCIPGICGQVNGSVLPGLIGIEAGQGAFGDVYAWFRRLISAGGEVALADLEKEAAKIRVTPDSPLSVDWFNGRRTPYANARLSGAVFGLDLGVDAPAFYRALAEGTVFGARAIVEQLKSEGVPLDEIIAIGGISKKSPFVMQLSADVFGMPIHVSGSEQACASGSAMLASVSCGIHKNIFEAMEHMCAPIEKTYMPNHNPVLELRYRRYLEAGKFIEEKLLRQL